MSRRYEQELAAACQYEPLPSLPETELHLPDLVGGESYEWAAIDNLDSFFQKIYRYWHDKGLTNILIGRLLNLTALAFTICFSGFLLLVVDWAALHSDCLLPHEPHRSCDLLTVAVHKHPWKEHPRILVGVVGLYLVLCGAYWVWSAVQLVFELRDVLDVKHFVNNKLGISDRQIRMMTWSELLHRLVLVQGTTRLCAVRDLDELDIVGRIMRKENYLIGMLNAGVLALYVRGCGSVLGRRFMLTKTLEWNLYLCILDPMFDDHFHIRQEFLMDEGRLRKRLVAAAVVNLVLSPFLLLFLVIYFFMKHAERFYHSPGSLGSRRWSSLSRWQLREFSELPHYVQHRLDASYEAAVKYVGQFPSPLASQIAKFVSFIAGSFAALLLGLSLLDENLLEVPLGGRNVVWWLALTGILLTVSRTFISDTPVAFDPERAMAELVLHTHYLPRHWRGRAHTAEVQQAVNSMFTYKVLLFVEELASVVLTPFILAYSLSRCTGAILQFVSEHTTRIEGVGDVCSLAAFDFSRHGNSKYGAPTHATEKRLRSKQGKMEKSFLTFVATYPTWQPSAAGRRMLNTIGSVHTGMHPAAAAAAAQQQGMFAVGKPDSAAAAAAAGVSDQMNPGSAAGQGVRSHWDESVVWQQQGGSAAAAATSQQQQQPMDGSSSVWLGVAQQPHVLRHLNHEHYHHQRQQRFAGQQGQINHHQQQQQQRFSAAAAAAGLVDEEMGAGIGGLGSSPPDLATAFEPSGSRHQGTGMSLNRNMYQQSSDAPADGDDLADSLFGPLPAAAADDEEAGARQEAQQLNASAAGVAMQQTMQGPAAAGGSSSGRVSQLSSSMLRPLQQQQQHPLLAAPLPATSSRYAPSSRHHTRQQQQQQHNSHRQHPYPQQQQQQQQQQQRYSQHYSNTPYSLLPSQQLLQLYPSTMYPGGPSAAAALSQFGQQYPGFGLNAVGASLLAASAAGSDLLPTNETDDLSSRVAAGHSLLQSFYESQDLTVQHRQHNRVHARSVMLGHSGSAAAAAAAVAAMAAASASHHAVPSGDW